VLYHPATDPAIELDSVVDEWPNHFFSLARPCGSTALKVRSLIDRHKYLDEDRANGPITLARFQYPDNVLDETYTAAPEDLFSYFTLLGRCSSCRTIVTISSVECA